MQARCTRRGPVDRRWAQWGLVAIAEFDLVAWIFSEDFGTTNAASRIVYGLVGVAAIYAIAAIAGRRSVGAQHTATARGNQTID